MGHWAHIGGRIVAVALAAAAVLSAGGTVLGSGRNEPALPEEKRILLAREDRLRTDTPVRSKPLSPEAPGPAVPTDAEWPKGIFDDGEFPSADYRFVNRWSGLVRGRHVTVYAGSYAANSRGLVLVMSVSRDLKDVEAREYPIAGAGPVRIVEATGVRLSLVAADGAVLGFDVVSRSFVPV